MIYANKNPRLFQVEIKDLSIEEIENVTSEIRHQINKVVIQMALTHYQMMHGNIGMEDFEKLNQTHSELALTKEHLERLIMIAEYTEIAKEEY